MSRTVARQWDEGLVAGTGTLGVVLHGTPACHVLDISHEEFFFTIMDARPAPVLASVLPDVRRLLLAGDAARAAALVDARATECGFADLTWTDPFVPAASVTIVAHTAEAATAYRRTGNFDTGEVAVEWRLGEDEPAGPSMRIAVLPLRRRDIAVVEIRAATAQAVTLTLRATAERAAPIDEFAGVDSSGRIAAVPGIDGDALTLTVRPTGEAETRTAHTRLVVHPPTAARNRYHGDGAARLDLDLAPGAPVYLAVTVDVQWGERATALSEVDTLIDRNGWQGLVVEQHHEHGELTRRSGLALTGSAVTPDVETLFAAARTGDQAATLGLVELAYAAGRHTIISATGVLPPNLQGVWQGSWTAPWSSDYTMNGNLQTAVAALASTGTPELLLSVFRLLDRLTDDFADNARRIFGADGYLLPARATTHGRANHFTHDYPHQFWLGNGGWLLRLAYEYFVVTGDLAFVETTALPLAREVLRFYASVLIPDERGLRHVIPCFSPENTPSGASTPLSVDATSEVAMIRDGVRVAGRFAELVGDRTSAAEWTAIAETLPRYRVAADGSLAEWLSHRHQEQPAHRHASQLYPLLYEHDPWLGPVEEAAATTTIAQKLAWREAQPGPQQMAFGLVHLGLAAAHLGDAQTSLRCVEMLVRDHWKPNLVSTHDEGAIFNVDACGGVPALVAEMLLQSTVGELRVLPALPNAWLRGRVTGLRGRGGIIVDELSWSPQAASMSCRFLAGSAASRTDATVHIVPPRQSPGQSPRTVQLSEQPTQLHFRME